MHRQYKTPIGHSHVCTMWPRGSPDGIWPSQSSVMMEIRHSVAFYSECADFESMRASLKKKKKKEKKMHILKEHLFPVSFPPLYFSLPVPPHRPSFPPLFGVFVFTHCAFGSNSWGPGDKAGQLYRCYAVLCGSFRFRYKDKEFHPTFSHEPVRECDFGSYNSVVEQNHYGSFMPTDKCLPDNRKSQTVGLTRGTFIIFLTRSLEAGGPGCFSGSTGSSGTPSRVFPFVYSDAFVLMSVASFSHGGWPKYHVLSCQ